MSQQRQNGAVRPPASSQTTTTTTTTTVESVTSEGSTQSPRILRLRGRHNANGRSVQWAEDVVDNEGLGRKSSKVCCIYHKPKAVGESSDESSSDSSSSDSDSDSDDGAARPTRRASNRDHKCDHPDHDHDHDHGGERRKRKEKRSPSPNAYEKIPKYKTSSQGKDEGTANGNTGS